MTNYETLREIATELLGAGWTAEEKEDIIAQHGDDVNLTNYEWDKVCEFMKEYKE